MRTRVAVIAGLVFAPIASALPALAQGTVADYQRAMGLRDKQQGLAQNIPEPATWIEKSPRFWYRKAVKGGNEFVLVEAATEQKRAAFDHEKLAAALTAALKPEKPYTGDHAAVHDVHLRRRRTAPSRSPSTTWSGGARSPTTAAGPRRRADAAGEADAADAAAAAWQARCAPSSTSTASKRRNHPTASSKRSSTTTTWPSARRARPAVTLLSIDGSEGGYYDPNSIVWSPDSKKIAAYKIKPGYRRYVHYVQSSPEDQLQPKHSTLQYAKPGDVLDAEKPVIFHVDTKKQIVVDDRAVSERLRQHAARLAEGQQRRHVRVQPARPPGLPRDRDRRDSPASRARSSAKSRRRSSRIPASATGFDVGGRQGSRSGCRSATAGTTSISTTAPRAP